MRDYIGGITALFFKKGAITNIKHITTALILFTLALMIMVLILGWMSAVKVRETVIADFNRQQLILAKNASAQIQNTVESLKRELQLLSYSTSIQYSKPVYMVQQMGIVYVNVRDKGVYSIKYVENTNKETHIMGSMGHRKANPSQTELDYLKWAEQNKDTFLLTDAIAADYDGMNKLTMQIIRPVWQVSIDETHPIPANDFAGVLMFDIDITALIEGITKDIISGKTGYSWVIDERGIFLYHPDKEFVGNDSFKIRHRRNPQISYEKINAIQKAKMLTGEEGTDNYITGWHRGQYKKTEKLIAFTPVNFIMDIEADNTAKTQRLWSVAVVAPANEVEDNIHAIQIRQFILEGVFIIVLFTGGIVIIRIMLNWSATLQKEVEAKTAELRRSIRQYRSLVENAHDIIFSVDSQNRLLSMNIFGYHFLHILPKDILGKDISAIFGPKRAELIYKAVREVNEGAMGKQLTIPILAGSTERWLSVNFSRLLDEKGEIYAILGIARDITESIEMEEQMCNTEKLVAMGTLVAGVAHEINNPIAIILGFSDILSEKIPKDSEIYELVKIIEKQGNNAKRVVENLLSFARCTERKHEEVRINETIEELFTFITNNLSLKQITIDKTGLSPSLPLIKAEAGELQQVFLNIINNAEHAMKGGGVLTVSTQVADNGKTVEIRFSDTGHGIKKEHRTKIFDPLFTTKKVGEGTGLGMSVSYGIITKYGGKIYFETKTIDESQEHGTTFIITLPGIHVPEAKQTLTTMTT